MWPFPGASLAKRTFLRGAAGARRCGARLRTCDPDEVQPRLVTVAPLLIVVCGALLGSCGGSDDGARRSAGTAAQPAPARAQQDPLAIPPGVPLRASQDGDPAATRVIRRWSDALRHGDVAKASALWSVPAKIQNATPVLTLASAADVRSFNSSLTCGSLLVAARGAAGGFTIATFGLTRRPGASCGDGTGHNARTAIRVRSGRISEWYRLPGDPDAPGPQGRPPDQQAPLQDDAPAI